MFVDITDTFEMKLRALRSHQSQVAKRDAEFDLHKMMFEWGQRLAAAGSNAGIEHFDEGNERIAEGFRILDTA